MSNEKISEELILKTIRQVLRENTDLAQAIKQECAGGEQKTSAAPDIQDGYIPDIFSIPEQEHLLVDDPKDREAYMRMKAITPAMLGTGKIHATPRDKTETYLRKHCFLAAARDAVLVPTSDELIAQMGFPLLKTKPNSIEEYLTEPYLGRQIDEENMELVRTKLKKNPDVQVIFGEANSGYALEVGMKDYWAALKQGLEANGINYGTPCFLRYPRLGAADLLAQEIGAKCVCVVVGERTCMTTTESMGAYITYNPHVGILENTRTVVSGIYKDGTPYVEAGAYTADLIKKILTAKKSGIELESGRGVNG